VHVQRRRCCNIHTPDLLSRLWVHKARVRKIQDFDNGTDVWEHETRSRCQNKSHVLDRAKHVLVPEHGWEERFVLISMGVAGLRQLGRTKKTQKHLARPEIIVLKVQAQLSSLDGEQELDHNDLKLLEADLAQYLEKRCVYALDQVSAEGKGAGTFKLLNEARTYALVQNVGANSTQRHCLHQKCIC